MIINKIKLAAAVITFFALSACSTMMGSSPPSPLMAAPDGVFVDGKGMAVYTFDKDVGMSGKSVCNGQCATNWPPMYASAADKPAGNWSVVTRDDGRRQWAYKGKPLYTWIKDLKSADRTGEAVSGWKFARP